MKGYEPINGKIINFLDITNDGLVIGESPNKRSSKLLDKVLYEAGGFSLSISTLFYPSFLVYFSSISTILVNLLSQHS